MVLKIKKNFLGFAQNFPEIYIDKIQHVTVSQNLATTSSKDDAAS
jgi:hypothetical protein